LAERFVQAVSTASDYLTDVLSAKAADFIRH